MATKAEPEQKQLPPHLQLFARLIDQIKAGKEAPVPAPVEIPIDMYLDPDWLEREQAELFVKRPIIIGHTAMLSETGSHFTHDHLDKPLLVVRGKDDQIRVFLNVCRHRGMRLVTEDGGKAPLFMCPYHQWTYELDGSLKNVPLKERAFEGSDLTCRNLVEVQSEVRHGFIWAQLDNETPIDLDAHLGSMNGDYEAMETADHHLFKQTTTVKKANWKLIVEAFQDGYHVVRLHNKTVGGFFLDVQSDMERVSDNLRAVVARKEIMDVLDAPPEQWDIRGHVSFAHFTFPNSIFVFHPDYISHMGLFPQGIDETVVVHSCLIPKAIETEKERDHWERSFDLIENGVFQSEDYFACENIQAGLDSGANDTLLLGGYEDGVVQFHNILRDVMGDHPYLKARIAD